MVERNKVQELEYRVEENDEKHQDQLNEQQTNLKFQFASQIAETKQQLKQDFSEEKQELIKKLVENFDLEKQLLLSEHFSSLENR